MLAHLFDFLTNLRNQHFYGHVLLRYQNGHVVLVEKNETIKPGADEIQVTLVRGKPAPESNPLNNKADDKGNRS